MAAGKYDFTIDQGETFSLTFVYKDSDGDLIDLTSYTAAMKIKENYTSDSLIDLTTENGGITLGDAEGTITLSISATDCAALDFESAIYDLRLTTGTTEIALVYGNVYLREEVTR